MMTTNGSSPLSKAWEDILVAPVGKAWVVSRRLLLGEPHLAGAPAAINNYGWHRHVRPFPSVSAVVVNQGEGMTDRKTLTTTMTIDERKESTCRNRQTF